MRDRQSQSGLRRVGIVVNMADGDLLVTISGAALSLLFFENVRSVGDQVSLIILTIS